MDVHEFTEHSVRIAREIQSCESRQDGAGSDEAHLLQAEIAALRAELKSRTAEFHLDLAQTSLARTYQEYGERSLTRANSDEYLAAHSEDEWAYVRALSTLGPLMDPDGTRRALDDLEFKAREAKKSWMSALADWHARCEATPNPRPAQ